MLVSVVSVLLYTGDSVLQNKYQSLPLCDYGISNNDSTRNIKPPSQTYLWCLVVEKYHLRSVWVLAVLC